MQSRILLIYTGGTIGMVKDPKEGEGLRPFNFDNLRKQMPELEWIPAQIDYHSFDSPIDSSDFKPKHWIQLAQIIEDKYFAYDGFVVLHGTDTMAYTASALSFMFKNLNKPVIFTGSQLPIGDLRTDAKENLITSLHFASLQKEGKPRIKEVCIYFEYVLLRANRTTKINAANFDAFSSPNFPNLGQSGVHLELYREFEHNENTKPFSVNYKLNSAVGLLKIFPGIPASFVQACFASNDIQCLIIEAFGAGNAFTDDWFIDEIKAAKFPVIIKTQCAGGRVELGLYETSKKLKELGAISAEDLTTEAAITKAINLLDNSSTLDEFRDNYQKNLRGELTDVIN